MIGIQNTNNIKMKSQSGNKDGTGDGETPSVGLYATWISREGWFSDVTLRHFWNSLDLANYDINGKKITYSLETKSIAGSFEFGRRFKLPYNFKIKPRVEVVASRVGSSNFTTSSGNKVSYDNITSLQGSLGLNIFYRVNENLQPFLKTAVGREFMGDVNIMFESTDLSYKTSETNYVFGGGVNVKLSSDSSIYLEMSHQNSKKLKIYEGNLGFRFVW